MAVSVTATERVGTIIIMKNTYGTVPGPIVRVMSLTVGYERSVHRPLPPVQPTAIVRILIIVAAHVVRCLKDHRFPGPIISMARHAKQMPIVILDQITFLNFYHRDGIPKASVPKKPVVRNNGMEIRPVSAVRTTEERLLSAELHPPVIYARGRI